MTQTRTAHTTACRAHAIGCAVENIRDMEPGLADLLGLEPVSTGDNYLTDGSVSCMCYDTNETLVQRAPWIIQGLRALDTSPW